MRKKLAIVRPHVAERQRKPLLACTLFTAYATWQRECDEPNAVMHRKRSSNYVFPQRA
ncbi:MAG: hypothetical protein ABI135_01745 [Rhodoferax sp.]